MNGTKETEDYEEFPAGWEDGAIVGSLKRNRDGSITVNIQIDVQGDGKYWQTLRKIRLELQRD